MSRVPRVNPTCWAPNIVFGFIVRTTCRGIGLFQSPEFTHTAYWSARTVNLQPTAIILGNNSAYNLLDTFSG
jgi:hypothetical protein